MEVARVLGIKASVLVLGMADGMRGIGNKSECSGVRDGRGDERYQE
jgi:hypothetical protein